MSLEFRYAVSFPWDYYRGRCAVADSAHPFVQSQAAEPRHVVFDFWTRMLVDADRYLFVLAEAFRQADVDVQVTCHNRKRQRGRRRVSSMPR